MLAVLTAADVQAWVLLTRAAFAARRREIDDLNVYPVPDGDTGTNLYLTIDGAIDVVAEAGSGRSPSTPLSLIEESEAFAKAMLLSARGNSGVLLSQMMRGFRDVVVEGQRRTVGPDDIAALCERGAHLARAGVAHPMEGTILTVADAAGRGARTVADAGGDLAAVVSSAVDAAREALRRTPEQLPALAAAGVVDAGGAGYVLLLESLHRVVTGEWDVTSVMTLSGGMDGGRRSEWASEPRPGLALPGPASSDGTEPTDPSFEVMYLLDESDDARVETLRRGLEGLGDSLLVVGGPDVWSVHVHVDDVGAAIEAGIVAGRPHRISVTHFAEQMAALRARQAAAQVQVAVVACAAGPGIAEVMAEAGAVTVASGPGARASAGQLLEAIRGSGARVVLLLPNDKDTVMAAEVAAAAATNDGLEVHVIPARTAVQGLAAVAVFEPEASVHRNVVEMSAAVKGTSHGAVTIATKEALTSGGHCYPGDALGIVNGDIVIVGADLATVAEQVLHRLLDAGGELVTLVVGEEGDVPLVETVTADLQRAYPGAEVEVVPGGQPHYPLLIGVE